MIKTIYTIYDSVSKTHWAPFVAFNDNDAKRAIGNCVNNGDPSSDLHLHPSDFFLMKHGSFNDTDHPIIEILPTLETVIRCDSLVISFEDIKND